MQTDRKEIMAIVQQTMESWNNADYHRFLGHFAAARILPQWAQSKEEFTKAQKQRRGNIRYQVGGVDISGDAARVPFTTEMDFGEKGIVSWTETLEWAFALKRYSDGWKIEALK
jgi:hypothetical protein